MPASESNWITLADVVKIKKLADNINFMRLYFLKSSDEQVNQLKLERNLLKDLQSGNGNPLFAHGGLELIDCVLSIFLFELYRLFRSGKTLYSKDQFQFKILYFFSRLKTAKVVEDKSQVISACFGEDGDAEMVRRRGTASFSEDEEESNDLCELID